ncbi:flagellar export protein FliJ [Cohnella caldifontis]|uniref:flagellar export protein FliJ n=1 Tax=Cohnella caldifontis TaxID=3027471 RepID=UPI0023EB1A35|nr:flagellar export protein FliJ [Cohnella sp. YIM B05605]
MQKIVDLKGSEKSMAEWEYAAAMNRLREEEEKLARIRAERREIEERLTQAAAGRVTLSELTSLQAYLEVVDARIERQAADVSAAEARVRERQGKLAEKAVEEKVWLKAREKAYEAFQYISLAKQQNELDELASIRAANRG